MEQVVIFYAFPADGGSEGLAAHSLSLVEVSPFHQILPAGATWCWDGGSRGLTAHSLGLVEVSFFIRSCQLVAHVLVVITYALPAYRGSGGLTAHSSGPVIGFPFHHNLRVGDTWCWW